MTGRRLVLLAGLLAIVLLALPAGAGASPARDIWVDPVRGSDSRSGASRATALRSISAAWNRVPANQTLTRPIRILVRSGTIAPTAAPNYWEHRWGSAAAPISIVSSDGPGRAWLPSINMFDVRHLTLDGVVIRSRFDAFHCERCDHLTLRRSAFIGIGDPARGAGPQESVKFNQSSNVRILDSYLAGATDNALDLVAVHGATVARSTIAHAVDWCAYAKGGSSDVEFVANHVHHCGTGGITLGQGTGVQFMTQPWTNYEAYGARVINNVVHDVDGAALGVNGGFAVLVAHNSAYRVGARDHVLEVVFGERSCDGTDDNVRCAEIVDAGGWGPRAGGGDSLPIGNSQVALMHNLIYNPIGTRSRYTHFAVYAPRPAGGSGGPDPVVADDGLLIRGNAIWNGPADLDLGLGGDQGCADAHPTCSPALVRSDNNVNASEPSVRVVASAVPVPLARIDGGAASGAPLPSFDWVGVPALRGVPPVQMPSTIERDRAGRARAGRAWQPGAYVDSAPASAVQVTGLASRGRVVARDGRAVTGAGGTLRQIRGDWLELTAIPDVGMRLVGWSGACRGQRGATCMVRATTPTLAVTARFVRR